MRRSSKMRNNPYLPHTDSDVVEMLHDIGAASVEELFSDIPDSIKCDAPLDLSEGKSEREVLSLMRLYAASNIQGISFLGCGVYDHEVPSAVERILSLPGFYTSYTPYQPEISQGVLQGLFEFQTMVCDLTGLDVTNASLYDVHTATAESAAMAINDTRHSDVILCADSVHPFTRSVLNTFFSDMAIDVITVPTTDGSTSAEVVAKAIDKYRGRIAALICQTPNFWGCIEDYTGFAEMVHDAGARFIISTYPATLAHLKSPGEWGADIAVCDGQSLGLPIYFGGPTTGILAAKKDLLRRMPGRIVGQTIDRQGQRAFVLTLQAREQHIKRSRATSNICSNQALAALGNAAFLALVGNHGLKARGDLCYRSAHYLHHRLTTETRAEALFSAPFYNEFLLRVPVDSIELIRRMREKGFFAGVPLQRLYHNTEPFPLASIISVAVTERRTHEELDGYLNSFKEALDECTH